MRRQLSGSLFKQILSQCLMGISSLSWMLSGILLVTVFLCGNPRFVFAENEGAPEQLIPPAPSTDSAKVGGENKEDGQRDSVSPSETTTGETVVQESEELMSISSSEPIVEAYGLIFLPTGAEKSDKEKTSEEEDQDSTINPDDTVEFDDGSKVSVADLKAPGMAVERRSCRIVKGAGLQWELYIMLKNSDRVPGAKLSAIASSSSGKVLGLRVRELLPVIYRAGLSIGCNPERIDEQMQRLVMLPLDRLKDLVEIRRRKRTLLLEKLGDQLSPLVLQKIRDAETSAGIFGEPQISTRLGPSVVARRLVSISKLTSIDSNSSQKEVMKSEKVEEGSEKGN